MVPFRAKNAGRQNRLLAGRDGELPDDADDGGGKPDEKDFQDVFHSACSYRFPLKFPNNRSQRAEVCEIHLLSIGLYERPVFRRLFFKGRPAQGLVQQFHHRPVTERELLVIDPAAKMKDLRPVKQPCGKLPSQRGADIVPVFRLVGGGQPYGDENQLLNPSRRRKGRAAPSFKPQDAAGIQATQIDHGPHAGEVPRVFV